jgi:hypothetical protein
VTDRPRRILLFAAVGLVIWYGLVLGVWALRSLSDTVPGSVPAPTVDAPKARAVTTVEFSCGTLFSPDDVVTPTTPLGIELGRTPCDIVISDARRVFALDTFVLVLGLTGVVLVRRRLTRTVEDAPVPAAV